MWALRRLGNKSIGVDGLGKSGICTQNAVGVCVRSMEAGSDEEKTFRKDAWTRVKGIDDGG